MPLCEADLVAWEQRRGVELEPWEADIVIDMAQAYMQAAHDAKHISAISPWPPGQRAYKMAMDLKQEKQSAEQRKKEQAPDGNRKRRRDPPPG